MDDGLMNWIQMEMEDYDRLKPEMQAVVQEYGNLPWDPRMSVEEFRASEQRMAELQQEYLFQQEYM